MNQEKIGKFIQELRKQKNLTQTELAEKLGVTEKSISNWENGRNMPDLSLFKPLCDELDISINEFMSGQRIKEDDYRNKLEENIINTIDFTNKSINKKNNVIGIILIIFGVFIAITAMSIFKSESSWGCIYSIFGVIISSIGISRFTSKLKYKLILNFGYFILFMLILFLIDYIGVINLNQAPRFAIKKMYVDGIMYYDTAFYDVIRCDLNEKTETWNIEKNKKRNEDDVINYCIDIARNDFYTSIKNAYKTNYVVISKLLDFVDTNEDYEYGYTIDSTHNKNQIVKVITDKHEIAKILEVLKNAKPIFGPVNLPGYTYLFQLGDDDEEILEFRMNELNDGRRGYSIGFSEEDRKILESFY